MKPIYQERGGLRYGDSYWWSWNETYPLTNIEISVGKIKIDPTAIVKLEFLRKDIKKIETYRGFFSKGIRIHHKKQKTGKFVVFWSFNMGKLLEALKKAGYGKYLDKNV